MKHILISTAILIALIQTGYSQNFTQHSNTISDGDITQLILGGEEVEAQEFPWMATLIMDHGNPGCAGTLIREDWVLTAGHCHFEGYLAQYGIVVQVLINTLTMNPNNIEPYSELIDVEAMISHEEYDFMFGGRDIALIKLATPSAITPITLGLESEADLYAHEQSGVTIGWGITGEGEGLSIPLLKTTCKFLGNSECDELYTASPQLEIDPYEICAGYFEGENPVGATQGDSGGPLLYLDSNGEYRQIGIVSGGQESVTTVEFPGIFTRVTELEDWINQTIEEYESSTSVNELSADKITVFMDDQNNINISGLNRFSEYEGAVFDLTGRTIVEKTDLSHESTLSLEVEAENSGAFVVSILNKNSLQVINKKCFKL